MSLEQSNTSAGACAQFTTREIYMQRLLALYLCALLILTACSRPASGPGPDRGITGTYHLQVIDEVNLPVTLEQVSGGPVTIRSGSVTLNADNTFSARLAYTPARSGAMSTKTIALSGTYLRNVSQVLFELADGRANSGALDGNEITWFAAPYAPHVFIFRRCGKSELSAIVRWTRRNLRCDYRATLPPGDTAIAAEPGLGSDGVAP